MEGRPDGVEPAVRQGYNEVVCLFVCLFVRVYATMRLEVEIGVVKH